MLHVTWTEEEVIQASLEYLKRKKKESYVSEEVLRRTYRQKENVRKILQGDEVFLLVKADMDYVEHAVVQQHFYDAARFPEVVNLLRQRKASSGMEGYIYLRYRDGYIVDSEKFVKLKIRKGAVISRALLKELQKLRKSEGRPDWLEDEWFDALERSIRHASTQLGSHFAKKTCVMRISTRPYDFLKLGELKCDHGSCFRFTSECADHKGYLMQTKNSVVLQGYMVDKAPESMEAFQELVAQPNGLKSDFRAWGYIFDFGELGVQGVFSNRYGMDSVIVERLTSQAFSSLFGEPYKVGSYGGALYTASVGDVYTNGDSFGVTPQESGWIHDDFSRNVRSACEDVVIINDNHLCQFCEGYVRYEGDLCRCDECSNRVCPSCTRYCADCDVRYCPSCWSEENPDICNVCAHRRELRREAERLAAAQAAQQRRQEAQEQWATSGESVTYVVDIGGDNS